MPINQNFRKERKSIIDQITLALDGRTQRWLALECKIPEDHVSRGMRGLRNFSDDELSRIEARLLFKIVRPKEKV